MSAVDIFKTETNVDRTKTDELSKQTESLGPIGVSSNTSSIHDPKVNLGSDNKLIQEQKITAEEDYAKMVSQTQKLNTMSLNAIHECNMAYEKLYKQKPKVFAAHLSHSITSNDKSILSRLIARTDMSMDEIDKLFQGAQKETIVQYADKNKDKDCRTLLMLYGASSVNMCGNMSDHEIHNAKAKNKQPGSAPKS